MSLQELHIRALEDQVVNLTRDCHYLMSLLNTDGNIDWDSWPQGQKIKEDLERSKDFFDAIQRRKSTQNDYATRRNEEEAARIQREQNENARKAREQLKSDRAQYVSRKIKESKNDSENYARQLFFSPLETKGYELEREARNEQRLAEECEKNIKLGSVWNRKKLNNVPFGYESFYDIGKFFDYLFHPIDF